MQPAALRFPSVGLTPSHPCLVSGPPRAAVALPAMDAAPTSRCKAFSPAVRYCRWLFSALAWHPLRSVNPEPCTASQD